MREGEDEMAKGFDRFVLLQLLVQFFDEEFAELLRAFADLEDAGEDVLTGRKPLIIGGALRVDQDVDLGYQEVLGHLVDVGVVQANDLRDFLDDVEIRLVGLHVDLEDVKEGFQVFGLDQAGVFGEGYSEDGHDCPLFVEVGLVALVGDELVPHVGEDLRLHQHDALAHRLRYHRLQYLLKRRQVLRSGLCEEIDQLLGDVF